MLKRRFMLHTVKSNCVIVTDQTSTSRHSPAMLSDVTGHVVGVAVARWVVAGVHRFYVIAAVVMATSVPTALDSSPSRHMLVIATPVVMATAAVVIATLVTRRYRVLHRQRHVDDRHGGLSVSA